MALTHAVDKYLAQLEPGRGLFVGGTWRRGPATFDVEDPATGEVVAAVSDAHPSPRRPHAVDAAYAAGPRVALRPRRASARRSCAGPSS